ncbi:MAG TPA: ABC transporter permease subunit [Caulobacteraceae bacterium]|nr:ABC transporter permease subunit [Caulobacteraceae bacterium]
MGGARSWAAPAVAAVVLLAAWELGCRLLHAPTYLLPAPSAVAAAGVDNAGLLAASAWRTLAMALEALLVAAAVAGGLAIAAALSRTVDHIVRPLAAAVQVTPVVAIAPLVVIWAGIDHPQRAIVSLAAVVAFFPLFSGAVAGLASADRDLERLFDLYQATPLQRLALLRAPSAAPFLIEAVKVAAGLAIIGAVVAEFVAGSGAAQGLAWRILEAGNLLQTPRMFAAILVLAAMAGALNGLLGLVEKRLLSWWRGR